MKYKEGDIVMAPTLGEEVQEGVVVDVLASQLYINFGEQRFNYVFLTDKRLKLKEAKL